MALSSHRLDVIERVFKATQDSSLLSWVLQLVVREGVIAGSSRAYKNEVLHLLIALFSSPAQPDYFSITQCFVYLNDPALASALLAQLLQLSPADPSSSTSGPSKDDVLTAYQIGFDLAETATQEFLVDAGRSADCHFFFVRVAPPRPRSGTSASSSSRCTNP